MACFTGAAATALRELPGVRHVDDAPSALTLTVHNGPGLLAPIVAAAGAAGMTLTSVEIVRPDLETVFLHLTGKALRN